MSVMVNERASAAVQGLRRALVAAGLTEVEQSLHGVGVVEDRAGLGVVADLLGELARMFAEVDETVEEAARHAFQVFNDQAGRRTGERCTACAFGLCPSAGFHTVDSIVFEKKITDTEPMCGCSCLRRKR